MVPPDSRPRLAEGLERADGRVFDPAMGRRIEVNEAGEFILDRMDGNVSVRTIAADVAERFGISEGTALTDTTALVDALIACSVAEMRLPASYYVRTVLGPVLPRDASSTRGFRTLFSARKRVEIRGGALASLVTRVGLRLLRRHLWLAGSLALLGCGITFVLLGELVLSAALVPALVSGASLLGMSLHEGAHLYALRRYTGDERLGYLRLTPLELGVGYPRARPEVGVRIAMAGPLLPAVCGAALYLVNALYPNPLLATVALLFAAHALSFLPLPGSDGSNLLSYATGLRPPARRWLSDTTRNAMQKEHEKGETVLLNRIGVALTLATILSTVVVLASAVAITLYTLTAGSSTGLGGLFAVSVERNGEFSVTLEGGLFLTFAGMVALATVVIGFLQIAAANRGER